MARTSAQRTELFADTGGHYALDDLPPGRYVLEATGDGGEAMAAAAVAVNTTTTVDLALAPSPRITGRVVDARTHEPVGGADLGIDATGPLARRFLYVKAGADGRFTLGPIARESITLTAGTPGEGGERVIDMSSANGTVDIGDIAIAPRTP